MKKTVAKEIYRHLAEVGTFIPSAELEKMNFLKATGSTISRKARLLESEGFLEVRYQGGTHHAEYRAIVGKEARDNYLKTRPEPKPELPKFVEEQGEKQRLWSVLVPDPKDPGGIVKQTTDMRVRDAWLSMEGARCLT